jgi:elongation factor P--(R)-beta-lysine ligase
MDDALQPSGGRDWRPTASLAVLELRARMLRAARHWFEDNGVLEVETPTLSAAAASDPHLASVAATVCGARRYLQTSPEFAMKRLLAAGSGDIYQIARVYRDAERGRWHNPEFTMIEWYRVGIDHHALMGEMDSLLRRLLLGVRELGPAHHLTYCEALASLAGVDALDDPITALGAALERAGVDLPGGIADDRDAHLDLIMGTVVGPRLGRDGRPTFIFDYPASQAALARRRGRVASRFELYLDGIELANGFHELTDPVDQEARFAADLELRRQHAAEPVPVDARLLAALRHGLPETAGVALGFDRLVMCATGARHIEDVIAIPFARA